MTALIITDIRNSRCDSGVDLITAIVRGSECFDANRLLSGTKYCCGGLLVLESATAQAELPMIGVSKGDQFVRIWAKPDHGLKVGEEMQLDVK